jgi:hypothetical protein
LRTLRHTAASLIKISCDLAGEHQNTVTVDRCVLGVNQFFIDLIQYAHRHPEANLLRWWSERQCAEPLRFGTVSMHRVRADAHGIYAEGTRRVGFFLEYDRGTEALPVLADKAQR